MSTRYVAAALVAAWIALARPTAAQPLSGAPPAVGPRAVPEIRLDAFAGRTTGAQLGLGVALDAGAYTRLVLVAGAGAERRPGGAVTGVQRLDALGRFHFDPYRLTRHALYAGGGVGLRHAPGGPMRALLVALLGVEGPPHAGAAWAVEAGVGGGARLGVALRRARPQRR